MDDVLDFVFEHKLFTAICFFVILFAGFFFFYLQDVTAEESFTCASVSTTSSETTEFAIDIKGAVLFPGVYWVSEGMIVDDAINLAGGLTDDADTSNLNLSKQLTSEMVITVFTHEEVEEENLAKTTISETTTTSTKISINTATLEELMTLPGIGEAKASLIIEYRETCGAFTSLEELKNINGIGDSLYEQISAYITL